MLKGRGNRPARSEDVQGRVVSYTTYHRVWHESRDLALPSALTSTPLAKRPYDLRDSALSTWLYSGADRAEVAERADNSVEVLLSRYAKCLYGRQSINNQRVEGLLSAYDQLPELDDEEQVGFGVADGVFRGTDESALSTVYNGLRAHGLVAGTRGAGSRAPDVLRRQPIAGRP
ncbi:MULTISPECIES: hypothetical protein [Streptomyces]|uniref:hypothetical protein n=1 Tax=Streptomyces TaxID=1883 RepID=UPI002E15B3BE